MLNSKVEDIINLSNKFEDIRIEHIYREGNVATDSLANLGADGHYLFKLNSNYYHIHIEEGP